MFGYFRCFNVSWVSRVCRVWTENERNGGREREKTRAKFWAVPRKGGPPEGGPHNPNTHTNTHQCRFFCPACLFFCPICRSFCPVAAFWSVSVGDCEMDVKGPAEGVRRRVVWRRVVQGSPNQQQPTPPQMEPKGGVERVGAPLPGFGFRSVGFGVQV